MRKKRKMSKDDRIFAKRTKEAWKEIDAGKFTSSSVEEFLKELKRL